MDAHRRSDLSISPQKYEPPNHRTTVPSVINDQKEIGPYTFTFLSFDASSVHTSNTSDSAAKFRVSYQGRDTIVTLIIRLVANETDQGASAHHSGVPGGKEVVFQDFDRVQRWAFTRVNGRNLPVDPAKLVVTVCLKPGILLVWDGSAIGVLDGLITLIRRTLEGQARLAGQPARLPRRLGGLARLVNARAAGQQPPEQ